MRNSLLICILICLFASNISLAQKNKNQGQEVEIKIPNWVSSRPPGGLKYIGVGVADKTRSSDFQMEAKKNALYDLASEIKVNISTNSVLYSVSSNNTFDQNFNSLIKLSNSDNIEGYTLVDTYENDKQYWAYYELDKSVYANLKAQKKQNVISKASNLIAVSFDDEKNKNFSAALKKRIQAFGILNPYLSEEIVFDQAQTKGVKTVFELTNLIQNQLQSITVVQPLIIPIVQPYQPNYSSINYRMNINSGTGLNNFPFKLDSEDDFLKLEEQISTNSAGDLQIKISHVEPQFQLSSITLNPDIERLTADDSVGKASIAILRQFIQTPSLKVQINIEPVSVFITSKESNFGRQLPTNMIEQFVNQKFNNAAIKIVDSPKTANYMVDLNADTAEDISNDVLENNFKLSLAQLSINITLKNNKGEVLYKNLLTEVYGYANSPEKAGMNSYSSEKLKTKLSESLFFLKRKMIIY